jgi:hypothetical protein
LGKNALVAIEQARNHLLKSNTQLIPCGAKVCWPPALSTAKRFTPPWTFRNFLRGSSVGGFARPFSKKWISISK